MSLYYLLNAHCSEQETLNIYTYGKTRIDSKDTKYFSTD